MDKFCLAGAEIPLESLRRHLLRKPYDGSLSPRRMETLVGEVFSDFMECEARHVGSPNDGGVDLILVQGQNTYAVHVKSRAILDGSGGVRAVREFVGAMVVEGMTREIFVTTTEKFTRHARTTAQTAVRRGAIELLELVEAKTLMSMLSLTRERDKEPWPSVTDSLDAFNRHVKPGFNAFESLLIKSGA